MLEEKNNLFFLSNIPQPAQRLLSQLRNYHPETYNHSVRVALLSYQLGEEFSFSPGWLDALAVSALLHDIGKLNVPLSILDKAGPLTEKEFLLIQSHPRSAFLLLHEKKLDAVRKIVVGHHEYDSRSPYPRQSEWKQRMDSLLSRKKFFIRLATQIISLADSYDALSQPRTYKPSLPLSEVFSVLKRQFAGDIHLVYKLIDLVS